MKDKHNDTGSDDSVIFIDQKNIQQKPQPCQKQLSVIEQRELIFEQMKDKKKKNIKNIFENKQKKRREIVDKIRKILPIDRYKAKLIFEMHPEIFGPKSGLTPLDLLIRFKNLLKMKSGWVLEMRTNDFLKKNKHPFDTQLLLQALEQFCDEYPDDANEVYKI